eukprot:XP_001701534.1 predicted protein [Chlamydomonas reinhardtii]
MVAFVICGRLSRVLEMCYDGLEARGACESHGVVTWPGRRERYEGQLVGSRPHGHGAYRWRDGTLYRGEWYAGHMHGCGVLIWRDAQGEVQAQLNWRSLRWNDGCTYDGLEARGACESHGVVTWPGRTERYEGQLVGSRPHGHGAYRWRDGTLYRGEWYAGHMHGCGVLIWRDAQGEVQAQPYLQPPLPPVLEGLGPAGKFFRDDYVGAVFAQPGHNCCPSHGQYIVPL